MSSSNSLSDSQVYGQQRVNAIERVLMERDQNRQISAATVASAKGQVPGSQLKYNQQQTQHGVNAADQAKCIQQDAKIIDKTTTGLYLNHLDSQSIGSESTCSVSQHNPSRFNACYSDIAEDENNPHLHNRSKQLQLGNSNEENSSSVKGQHDSSNSYSSLLKAYRSLSKAYEGLQTRYNGVSGELQSMKCTSSCSSSNNYTYNMNSRNSSCNINEMQSRISQTNSEEGDDRFTHEVNRAYRLMYANLKEVSAKNTDALQTEITGLKKQISNAERAIYELTDAIRSEKEKNFYWQRVVQEKDETIGCLQSRLDQLQVETNYQKDSIGRIPLTLAREELVDVQDETQQLFRASACFKEHNSQVDVFTVGQPVIHSYPLDTLQYETFQEYYENQVDPENVWEVQQVNHTEPQTFGQQDYAEDMSSHDARVYQAEEEEERDDAEENYISIPAEGQSHAVATLDNQKKSTCQMHDVVDENMANEWVNDLTQQLKSPDARFQLEESTQKTQRNVSRDKKGKRIRMLNELKKELFEEGLKQSLMPGSMLLRAKSSSRRQHQQSKTNTSRSARSQMVEEQLDPVVQEGLKIIQNLYDSLERKAQQ